MCGEGSGKDVCGEVVVRGGSSMVVWRRCGVWSVVKVVYVGRRWCVEEVVINTEHSFSQAPSTTYYTIPSIYSVLLTQPSQALSNNYTVH